MRYVAEYDGTPPSLNKHLYSHWRKQHRVKRQWQGIFEVLLMEIGLSRVVQGAEPIRRRAIFAEADLYFPTFRRRDEGNYRWILEKALGDALTNGGWLEDDTREFFSVGAVRCATETVKPLGLTRLYLYVSDGPDAVAPPPMKQT